ncbi:hypothetical protein DFH07DRAFT_779103 [Mycena maculata]|uniref:Uncharacterized protein n=1 Tax=Mycena maculata TaxID=230809 RepID=A0AAD7MYP7_9AGAR|nr:hypothetical protein DFH07DRAFT_779103 [Mycena maculata]
MFKRAWWWLLVAAASRSPRRMKMTGGIQSCVHSPTTLVCDDALYLAGQLRLTEYSTISREPKEEDVVAIGSHPGDWLPMTRTAAVSHSSPAFVAVDDTQSDESLVSEVCVARLLSLLYLDGVEETNSQDFTGMASAGDLQNTHLSDGRVSEDGVRVPGGSRQRVVKDVTRKYTYARMELRRLVFHAQCVYTNIASLRSTADESKRVNLNLPLPDDFAHGVQPGGRKSWAATREVTRDVEWAAGAICIDNVGLSTFGRPCSGFAGCDGDEPASQLLVASLENTTN